MWTCASSWRDHGWSVDHPVLSDAQQVVAFAVEDTGIGVAPEKQRLIFEAFQQADAGTSRKYGGTGLGLAISRELAVLLGGEIRLASVHGQGSTFTLYLPLRYAGAMQPRATARGGDPVASEARPEIAVLPVAREEHIADDRDDIDEGDPVLLIIEDDPHYARILLGLARDKGFKGIVATKGAHGPLAGPAVPPGRDLARHLPARHARLDGAQPAQARPGHAPHPGADRHARRERQHGLAHGAFSYLVKAPTTEGLEAAFDRIKDFTARAPKRLLVVEDNDIERAVDRRAARPRRHRDRGRSAGGEALEALLERTPSTASCSTCACPT